MNGMNWIIMIVLIDGTNKLNTTMYNMSFNNQKNN